MNEKAEPPAPPSPAFLAAFERCRDGAPALRFDAFMELALYDPEVGYYRRPAVRVGRRPDTDFFTAASCGPLFGELVALAASRLVSDHGGLPSEHAFVELGAEPGGGVLGGIAHPFASYRACGIADEPNLHGPCVVFSNELFDAQPCRRLLRLGGGWRERGVAAHNGRLEEVDCGVVSESWLPPEAPEGYRLDAPRAAAALCARIALRPWHGLFLAFDYGRSWDELGSQMPGGTLRAYYRHTQSNDVLARPGEQDLTCHICWDWLEESLRAGEFSGVQLQSQEAFLVRHAAGMLAGITASEAGRFSERKQALLQLLHPSHLGWKFQALHAWRADARARTA